MNFVNVLEPILSRLRLIVGRCTVIASKYVSGELETDVELIAGEKRRSVEFVQQYGFSSRPKGEVDGIALFIGGSRENGVVVATHSDFPEKLEEGEVAVHSPFGQYIWLKKDGSIVAKPTNGKSFLVEGALDVDYGRILQLLLGAEHGLRPVGMVGEEAGIEGVEGLAVPGP